MLGEVFYWVFNMSIAAAITGCVILLIRRINRIPRRVIALLWAIPFLRMLVPVGLGSKYGLMSLISRYTTKTVTVYVPATFSGAVTVTNYTMAADSYFPITYKTNLLEDLFRVASVIWLSVAVILIIMFGVLYVISMREVRGAEHLSRNVYVSDKVSSPSVYGIFRPRIIIPAACRDKDLTFVLMHERAHIRRADNLWRSVAFITAALHWFNPLAWVFLKYFLCELELSCDEKVLSRCGEEQKKAYALALVEYSESKSLAASAFGGAKLRVRIENILSYKKISAVSLAGFVCLAAAVAYMLLTNAM